VKPFWTWWCLKWYVVNLNAHGRLYFVDFFFNCFRLSQTLPNVLPKLSRNSRAEGQNFGLPSSTNSTDLPTSGVGNSRALRWQLFMDGITEGVNCDSTGKTNAIMRPIVHVGKVHYSINTLRVGSMSKVTCNRLLSQILSMVIFDSLHTVRNWTKSFMRHNSSSTSIVELILLIVSWYRWLRIGDYFF